MRRPSVRSMLVVVRFFSSRRSVLGGVIVLATALGLGCRSGQGVGEQGPGTTTEGTTSSGTSSTGEITAGSTTHMIGDTTSGACNPECEPGFECVDGTCEETCPYDAGCCEGGPCRDECLFSEGCPGGICEQHDGRRVCREGEPLPVCALGDVLGRRLDLPSVPDDYMESLAFGDALPRRGDELLVLRFYSTYALLGGGTETTNVDPFGTEGSRGHAVAIDLGARNGFALQRFPEGLRVATIDGGQVTVGELSPVFPSVSSAHLALAAGDFDGDGVDDLVKGVGQGVGIAWGTGSGFIEGPEIPWPERTRFSIVGRFDDDALDDIAFHELDGPSFLLTDVADTATSVELPGGRSEERGHATGDFDGDGEPDIVGLGKDYLLDNIVLFPWRAGPDGSWSLLTPLRTPMFLVPPAYFAAGVGDFDGDGADDVSIGSTHRLGIFFGDPTGEHLFRCHGIVDVLGAPAITHAVGDIDGDGRSDIALSNGPELIVLVHRYR